MAARSLPGLIAVFCLWSLITEYPSTVVASAGNEWQYKGMRGPNHWHMDYPHCGGVKQSPIDIVTADVIVDEDRLRPIILNGFDRLTNANMTLTNNGHTVKVILNDNTRKISGGGLPGVFAATQFHFHWGAVDSRGSEHDINGHFFPMEMHIVLFNEQYGSFDEAMDKDDGLAVLAFFFQVGTFNSHFEKIINHFNDIHYKGKTYPLRSIPLIEFIPSNLEAYYRYQGSLTTPPCYESVTWTLFYETIQVAEEQLESFRTMIFGQGEARDDGQGVVSDDFRPVQCLHSRKVYCSKAGMQSPPADFTPLNGNTQLVSNYALFSLTVLLVLWLNLKRR